MKLGTQILFADGRTATVIYNGLIGVGIRWGLHDPDPIDFYGTSGNTIAEHVPAEWNWEPEAVLRHPWDGCQRYGFTREQCIGTDYVVTRNGLGS